MPIHQIGDPLKELPRWLNYLFREPSILQDYKNYLHFILEKKREELEQLDDMVTSMKIRGAISAIKELLLFIGNYEAEKLGGKKK